MISSGNAHQLAIERLAKRYKREGYRVIIEPGRDDLPADLRDTAPDLLAISREEAVIVEVKGDDADRADKWARFAEFARKTPGWRFDLYTGKDLAELNAAPLSSDEIRKRFEEASELFSAGYQDAALLSVWSGIEATLRLLASRKRLKTVDQRPGTLIGSLYAEGFLDDSQYRSLLRAMEMRNRAVHGYRLQSVSRQELDNLRQIGFRLAA